MYTIKQAAGRSGVSVPLLRAWERRYGIVQPVRTPSGYRLYDDASIARLRAMRRLVDDGWAPSTAASHIRDADDEVVTELLEGTDAGGTTAAADRDADTRGLMAAFVDAARAFDEPGFEAVLDEMFARGTFERVASELVMPSLVAIGEGWASGDLDVAAEHAAASAVSRRLGSAFLAAGRPRDEWDIVLVGLPPGARHELGALAFATAARRAGLAVRYLGADLPVEDWLEVAAHTSAVAAVIGVVIPGDVGPATEVAAALREARPGIVIGFGGHSAHGVTMADPELDLLLPEEIAVAVERLRDALSRARR